MTKKQIMMALLIVAVISFIGATIMFNGEPVPCQVSFQVEGCLNQEEVDQRQQEITLAIVIAIVGVVSLLGSGWLYFQTRTKPATA